MGEPFVRQYLDAVEDVSPVYREAGVVPPLAVVALAVAALLERLGLPPGTVHAAQELECRRVIQIDEQLSCAVTLSRAMRRGEWRLMTADLRVLDRDGAAVLGGKITVLVPNGEGGIG